MPYAVDLIQTDGTVVERVQHRQPDLNQLQAMVGGSIEYVPHLKRYKGNRYASAVMNETGKLTGMALNRKATALWLENLGPGPFRYKPELFGPCVVYYKTKS